MERLDLEIVTPTGRALKETVDEVTAPSVQGEFGVLPGHVPLVAALRAGIVSYRIGADVKRVAVGAGFAEAGPNKVVILADDYVERDKIDPVLVRRELAEVQTAIAKAESASTTGTDGAPMTESLAALILKENWLAAEFLELSTARSAPRDDAPLRSVRPRPPTPTKTSRPHSPRPDPRCAARSRTPSDQPSSSWPFGSLPKGSSRRSRSTPPSRRVQRPTQPSRRARSRSKTAASSSRTTRRLPKHASTRASSAACRTAARSPLPVDSPKTIRFGVVLVGYAGAQPGPVGDKPNPRDKADAKVLVEKLAGEAVTDFHSAVQRGDPGSADDLGHIHVGFLEPLTDYMLFSLKVDEVSPAFDTPRGYWIAKRLE